MRVVRQKKKHKKNKLIVGILRRKTERNRLQHLVWFSRKWAQLTPGFNADYPGSTVFSWLTGVWSTVFWAQECHHVDSRLKKRFLLTFVPARISFSSSRGYRPRGAATACPGCHQSQDTETGPFPIRPIRFPGKRIAWLVWFRGEGTWSETQIEICRCLLFPAPDTKVVTRAMQCCRSAEGFGSFFVRVVSAHGTGISAWHDASLRDTLLFRLYSFVFYIS